MVVLYEIYRNKQLHCMPTYCISLTNQRIKERTVYIPCTVKPANVVTCIKRSSFSCSVVKISYELNLF